MLFMLELVKSATCHKKALEYLYLNQMRHHVPSLLFANYHAYLSACACPAVCVFVSELEAHMLSCCSAVTLHQHANRRWVFSGQILPAYVDCWCCCPYVYCFDISCLSLFEASCFVLNVVFVFSRSLHLVNLLFELVGKSWIYFKKE